MIEQKQEELFFEVLLQDGIKPRQIMSLLTSKSSEEVGCVDFMF